LTTTTTRSPHYLDAAAKSHRVQSHPLNPLHRASTALEWYAVYFTCLGSPRGCGMGEVTGYESYTRPSQLRRRGPSNLKAGSHHARAGQHMHACLRSEQVTKRDERGSDRCHKRNPWELIGGCLLQGASWAWLVWLGGGPQG